MSQLNEFFWLFGQANSGLVYAWPITVLLTAVIVAGVIVPKKRPRRSWRRYALLTAPLVASPFVVLASGAIWAKAAAYPKEAPGVWTFVLGFMALEVLYSIFAVFKSKDSRLLMLGTSLFVLHYTFWSYFIAGMAIADDWV